MTVEEKLWKLVQLLDERTEANTVAWEAIPNKKAFQTAFPNSAVRITEVDTEESPDYVISVFNESGTLIERASDVDIGTAIPNTKSFAKMADLYKRARRGALGVDRALDHLLESLSEARF